MVRERVYVACSQCLDHRFPVTEIYGARESMGKQWDGCQNLALVGHSAALGSVLWVTLPGGSICVPYCVPRP
jgi:hypothetical protein